MTEQTRQPSTHYKFSLKRNRKEYIQTSTKLANTLIKPSPLDMMDSSNNQLYTRNLLLVNPELAFDEHLPQRRSKDANPIYQHFEKIVEQYQKQDTYLSKADYKCLKHQYIGEGKEPKIKTDRQSFRPHFQRNQSKYYINPNPRDAIPEGIMKMYEQAKQLVNDNHVHFQMGYLQHTGYFYYAIGQKLVLVHSSNHYNFEQPQQPIILRTHKQVISVKEVILSQKDMVQIGHFGFSEVSLILVKPWQLQFYNFDFHGRNKLLTFKMRFDLSCQIAHQLDYDHKGNLFYLNDHAELFKLQFKKYRRFYQKQGRYSVKNYICYGKPSLTRKKLPQINISFVSTFQQLMKDASYFFSSKIYHNRSLICDKERQFIYTLIRITVKESDKSYTNQQLRIYNNCRQQANYIWQYNKPQLIQAHSENQLFYLWGNKLNELTLQQFQIYKIKTLSSKEHPNSNLLLILTNGCRLYVKVEVDSFILMEIIGFPSIEDILIRKSNISSTISSHYQIINETVCRHSWVVDVQWHRRIYSLLIHKINLSNEEITILQWPQPDHDDGSIFVNANHRQYYVSTSLPTPSQKQCLYKASPYVSQNPLQTQILCKCAHFIYIKKNRLYLLSTFRPIDMLFSVLHHDHQSSSNVDELKIFKKIYNPKNSEEDKELQPYNHQEIVCMLTQIYCDPEGKYYGRFKQNQEKDLALAQYKHLQGWYKKKIIKLYNFMSFSNPIKSQIKGCTLYAGRLLSSLWNADVQSISAVELAYLTEIFSNMKEIVGEVEQYLQLWKMVQKIIQLNRLLCNVDHLPKITYKQAILADYCYFQPAIFNTIQAQFKPRLINDWKYLFPHYISQDVYRAVKLYQEISLIKEAKKIMEIIQSQSMVIPQYFIEYLKQRNIKTQLLGIKLQNKSERKSTPINSVEKIYQNLKQVDSQGTTLEKKIFIINSSFMIYQSLTENEKSKHLEQQLIEYKYGLRIQKLIRKYYEQSKKVYKHHQMQLLTYHKLTPNQLLSLTQGIGSLEIMLIYFGCFGAHPSSIKDILSFFCQKYGGDMQKLKKNIKYVFSQIPSFSTHNYINKLPLPLILEALDQCVVKYIDEKSIELAALLQSKTEHVQSIIWVADLMVKEGWDQIVIFQHYLKESEDRLNEDMRLIEPNQFLYYWLNAYFHVKNHYVLGKRLFRNFTHNILNKIENKAVMGIVDHIKLLLDQLNY